MPGRGVASRARPAAARAGPGRGAGCAARAWSTVVLAGFEPVPDSAKSPRNPAFVGKTEGLCGSERVRKRLTERETAGSTAGSGQPSGTSTAESFLRRVGRRSVGNRPRSGEIETRASTKCRPGSPGASSDIRRIACSAVRHCGRRLGVPPTLSFAPGRAMPRAAARRGGIRPLEVGRPIECLHSRIPRRPALRRLRLSLGRTA